MDEDRQGQSIYLRWTNRQKMAINIHIPTMAEERQGQLIYLQWTKTNKGNQIYLRLTNRQTRAINIPTFTMNEQTDKGNQYNCDGQTNKQTNKDNQ